MKKITLALFCFLLTCSVYAAIDMQAHVASDDGRAAYTTYVQRQNAYYTSNFAYDKLFLQSGTTLFGSLNTLMGNTSQIGSNSLDYGTLRYEYVNVDRDLNTSGKIIGFYNGVTLSGTWNTGWNREHTWPQSKGANKNIPMGHDMQSVRPTSTSVNSSRGNDAFGESASYYDPNEIAISNANYKKKNNGSYRGDCARVIMYDYVVYGKNGSYSNSLYNGNAQLLSKLGTEGLFESVEIMLKWHMQDPPSLTEMVRNDGGQDYQGNRNPFIDFPEFAIMMLGSEVTTYKVSCTHAMTPNYPLTTKHGFVVYLSDPDGKRPKKVEVKGATGKYEADMGRLTVTNVTGAVSIICDDATALEQITEGTISYYTAAGQLHITQLQDASVRIYDINGSIIYTADNLSHTLSLTLNKGMYILQVNNKVAKVIL